jgi:hypothetical protein
LLTVFFLCTVCTACLSKKSLWSDVSEIKKISTKLKKKLKIIWSSGLLWIIHIIKNDSFIYKSQEHTNVQIKVNIPFLYFAASNRLCVASKWVIANCNQSQLRSIKNYSDMCSMACVSNYLPNHAFYSIFYWIVCTLFS